MAQPEMEAAVVSDKEKRAALIDALTDHERALADTDKAELSRVRDLIVLFRRLTPEAQLDTIEGIRRRLTH